MTRQGRIRTFAVLCAAAIILAACYLPDHFKSEVRVGSNGDYAISFYGDLIWAPLYRDIQRGNVPADEIRRHTRQFNRLRVLVDRKDSVEAEGATFPEGAVHGERAAHTTDQSAGDSQT